MLLQEERKLFGFKSKPPSTPGSTRSKEQRRNSISSGSKNPALSNRDNSGNQSFLTKDNIYIDMQTGINLEVLRKCANSPISVVRMACYPLDCC